MTAKNTKNMKPNSGRKGKRRGKPVPPTVSILPQAFRRCYLGYQANSTLVEAAAGTGNFVTFRANSVYDPDFTGVGTTAIGYTNLAGFFRLFRVTRVRVMARVATQSTGAAVVGLIAGMNTTFTAAYNRLSAQPNTVSRLIQGNVGGANSMHSFDQTYDMAKIAGVTKAQYMNDFDFAHAASANPARGVYVTLFMAGMSTAVQTVVYDIRLIYEVELSGPWQGIDA